MKDIYKIAGSTMETFAKFSKDTAKFLNNQIAAYLKKGNFITKKDLGDIYHRLETIEMKLGIKVKSNSKSSSKMDCENFDCDDICNTKSKSDKVSSKSIKAEESKASPKKQKKQTKVKK